MNLFQLTVNDSRNMKQAKKNQKEYEHTSIRFFIKVRENKSYFCQPKPSPFSNELNNLHLQ